MQRSEPSAEGMKCCVIKVQGTSCKVGVGVGVGVGWGGVGIGWSGVGVETSLIC